MRNTLGSILHLLTGAIDALIVFGFTLEALPRALFHQEYTVLLSVLWLCFVRYLIKTRWGIPFPWEIGAWKEYGTGDGR